MTPNTLSALTAAAAFAFLSAGAITTAQAAPHAAVVVHTGAHAHGQPAYQRCTGLITVPVTGLVTALKPCHARVPGTTGCQATGSSGASTPPGSPAIGSAAAPPTARTTAR